MHQLIIGFGSTTTTMDALDFDGFLVQGNVVVLRVAVAVVVVVIHYDEYLRTTVPTVRSVAPFIIQEPKQTWKPY